jgi:NTP pyrophosphatase (non-canonical NTP hydrolase)
MNNMTLNEYQKQAMTTCMPSSENFSYMFLNLVGEVGEFASKVAKAIRKGQCSIGLDSHIAEQYECGDSTSNDLWQFGGEQERLEELKKEAGDVLWQLSGLCTVMGWSLEDVAQMNLDKLAARKQAGTIDGNGDGIIRGR